MKRTIQISLLATLALTLTSLSRAQNAPDVQPRVGPVEAPATLRPPLATEVERPTGKAPESFLLPGFSYDTNFACLKWFAQGPGLTTNGDLNISPDHQTSGGVSAIAPHPSNPDILYIGTVNGGVWRSDNASSTNISWRPLTDDQLSLSIGGLALDPTDASGQTLVAGIGRRSSFSSVGGAQIGLLRTTDGGNSWTRLGATALAGRSIYNLAVRGNTMLLAVVSTDNGTSPGLYRTTDGGVNFTNMSGFAGSGLPVGAVTHLAADPANNARFFAHVASTGVYRSDDSGASWVNVSAGMAAANVAQLALTVFNRGGTNVVYAAELAGTSRVYRSSTLGASWVQMDSIVANTSGIFNGFTADPANPNLVYLAGLYVRANYPYSGRVVRGDASLTGGSQWTSIASTNGTGVGTAPHTDSRALSFNSAGRLIEGDDGGIYELPVANTGNNGTTSLWRSLNGNLQVSEMHSMDYDRLSKVFIGGAQDTGFQEQVRSGEALWNKTSNGDGGDAAVDVTSLPNRSIRYGSSQNLGGFFRATYSNNVQLSRAFPARTPLGGAPAMSGQFVNPIALNAVNPLRLLFGAGNGVYESLNQGDSVSRLNTSVANSPARMAYGGRVGTVTNADVIYVGVGTSVQVRTNSGGALPVTPAAFPGGNVQSIVLDPADWRIAYVVGTTNIYSTANAGAGWVNLTGNLVGAGTFHSVEFLTLAAGNAIVVGTDLGAYIMRTATPGVWKTLGNNLPNAPVFDAHYDPAGNRLAISTFGRGAWLYDFNPAITNVVTTLAPTGPGSLGEAITRGNDAGCPNVITFAVTSTIVVNNAVGINVNTTILGPGTNSMYLIGFIPVFQAGTTNLVRDVAIGSVAVIQGALVNNHGSLVMENCLLNNAAGRGGLGGGVFNDGKFSATNCVFSNLSVEGAAGVNRGPGNNGGPGGGGAALGGAIYTEGTSLTLSGCAFVGNRVTGGNGGNGDGNSFNNDPGGNGGTPNAGLGGAVGQPGGAGGFGGGGGGGAGSGGTGFAGGAGGFGGDGGAPGAGGLYGGAAGGSFSSHSGGGGGGAGLGGAIFVSTGAVTMVNCTFTGNLATNGVGGVGSFGGGNGALGQGVGGAIFNLNGLITAQNLSFSGNIASTSDGNVSASTIVTNLADSGPGSLRQAIANAAVRPGSDTVTFDPALNGQTIRLTSAELLINDNSGAVVITTVDLPNGVVVSGEGARRIFRVASGSTVAVDSMTISNGVAPAGVFSSGGGGGGVFNQGRLDLLNCTLVRNSVPGASSAFAGAIANYGGDLRLTNCTLAFNTTWVGGAIYSYLGSCALSHCTIASNTASLEIGGVATESGPLSLEHTLLANPAKDLRQSSATIASGGYNLVADGTGSGLVHGVNGDQVGTTATPINPRLGPLQNNGGPMPTMLLTAGSPALDAGNPAFIGLGLTDQRGFPRMSGGRVDIGAVENCLMLFYPVVNSTLVDASGSSIAQLQGAGVPLFGFNRFGQANQSLALNDPSNTTSNYYRLRTSTTNNSVRDFGLTDDFTVSVWVWQRSGATNGWKVILGLSGAASGPDNPVFGLNSGKMYLSYWGNDVPGNRVIAPIAWNHLAWTYRAQGGQIALYVNGQLDASAVGHAHAPRAADLLIGFSEAVAGSYFQGALDDLTIYCEALSPNQIAALAGDANTPDSLLPAPVLSPGLAAATCGWSVREIYAHTNDPVLMPYDLPSAEYLASSTQFAKTTNYTSTVINRRDPETNPGGGGFFGGDAPFALNNRTLQGLVNGDDNYFVLAAQATIHIAVEDDYTFAFSTDDGARLRIKGAVFSSSTRLDTNNPANPAHRGDTLSYPGNTGDSKTLGVTHLTPGDYEVEFLTWEYGGGAFTEVSAARGAKTAVDGSFALLSPNLFATRPPLALTRVSPTQLRLNWNAPCFRLQSATNILGAWSDVVNGTNGLLVAPGPGAAFYRLAE